MLVSGIEYCDYPNDRGYSLIFFDPPRRLCVTLIAVAVFLMNGPTLGEPWLPPGDTLLRSDIQLLADSGVLRVPITTWPLSWSNIDAAVDNASIADLDSVVAQALQRIRDRLRVERRTGSAGIEGWLAASSEPRVIRNFENTPREKGEIGARMAWMGQRFAAKIETRTISNPSDQDSFRLDGSYVGMAVGNWMLSLGYPEQWWGPGWDGSLILSTNARPAPQISINRNLSTPFESRWLRWVGQWSLTSFMSQLDDNRFIEDAMLFGLRVTATPLSGLEIGLSRSAQWCGAGRPCDAEAFSNLLLGRDNVGVNVAKGQEPGNQLGGMDLRWASPVGHLPYAVYLQWIGEDSRQGGPQIGSWLRQLGVEFWGKGPGRGWQHRTHAEVADTMCREGGIGFGGAKPHCAYSHYIYQTGYRYRERPIGHGIDGDRLSYSVGSTLLDSRGNSLSVLARRIAGHNVQGSLLAIPKKMAELSVSYRRQFSLGSLSVGVEYSRFRQDSAESATDGSLEWWARFTTR